MKAGCIVDGLPMTDGQVGKESIVQQSSVEKCPWLKENSCFEVCRAALYCRRVEHQSGNRSEGGSCAYIVGRKVALIRGKQVF